MARSRWIRLGSRIVVACLLAGCVVPARAALDVQFVEPGSARLRQTPATPAQAKAFAKLDLKAMPYRDAVVHILADGTVRVRLGRAVRHASIISVNPTRQDAHAPH